MTITVVGRHGTCRFEPHKNRWRWMETPDGPWHVQQSDPLERDTMFIRQANAFLDAVDGHGPPLCPLEEGGQALAVNLAVLASADGGTWQTVDVATDVSAQAGEEQQPE